MRPLFRSLTGFLIIPTLSLIAFPVFSQQQQSESKISKSDLQDLMAEEKLYLSGYSMEGLEEMEKELIRDKKKRAQLFRFFSAQVRFMVKLQQVKKPSESLDVAPFLETAEQLGVGRLAERSFIDFYSNFLNQYSTSGNQTPDRELNWVDTRNLLTLKQKALADNRWEDWKKMNQNLERVLSIQQEKEAPGFSTPQIEALSIQTESLDPPKLLVYQPDPDVYNLRGAVRANDFNYTIKGFALARDGIRSLLINGDSVPIYSTNQWVYPVKLEEGLNLFLLEALSANGLITRDTLQLHYEGQRVSRDIEPKRYLLSIAIEDYDYQGLRKLESPVADAREMVRILTERYDFEVSDTLFDHKATMKNVRNALKKLMRDTRPHDEVIVYFAGHVEYDPDFDREGKWKLADDSFRNSSQLTVFNDIQADKLLVISDACFSGSLSMDGFGANPPREGRARWLLASGRLELVRDVGPNGKHSPFAYLLLDYLSKLDDPKTAYEVGKYLEIEVPKYSKQTPLVRSLPGDTGGEWTFSPRPN